MLAKSRISFIKSLQLKKYRRQEQSFLVQGAKSIRETLQSGWEVRFLTGTREFLDTLDLPPGLEVLEASPRDLESMGEFQSNEAGILVARTQPNTWPNPDPQTLALVLDDLRDPGNLGTIIRTADWYGITQIYASDTTADFYNPKVITATMGSFTRVKVSYGDIQQLMSTTSVPTYGAVLDGKSVYESSFGPGGLLVIGNESRGIRPELIPLLQHHISIPRRGGAESLNAAIATAILLDNITRHQP